MLPTHFFRPRRLVFSLIPITISALFCIVPISVLAADPNDPPADEQHAAGRSDRTWLDSIVSAEPKTPAFSLSDWRQLIQDSLTARMYQPVSDYFRKYSNTSGADLLYAEAMQMVTDLLTSQPDSEVALYARKHLLFLQIQSKRFAAAEQTLSRFQADCSDPPQLSAILREAADLYYYSGQISASQYLYQQALGKASGEEILLVRRGLVMTHLRLGDHSSAEAILQTLLSDHSDHPRIAPAVKEIANAYFYYTSDSSQAHLLYQRILSDWPDSSEAMAAQRGLVLTHLRMAEYGLAESAMETLLSKYLAHPRIALAVKEVANAYLYDANDPVRARQLYQRILADWPDSSEAMAAQRGLALTAIELADKTAAQTAAEKLLSDYSTHPRIALAVREVADRYFYHGNDPARACALYQRILRDWPNSSEAMAAQRGLAMAKINLGDSASGQTAAEKLLSDFTDQPGLEIRMAEVIHQYCRAGRTAEVIALSEKILNQNPSSAMRLAAYTGLAQVCIQLGQEAKADEIITILLSKYAEEKRITYSLFVIGEEYYVQGEKRIGEGRFEEGREALVRALATWETVRAQSADPLHQIHAVYFSAEACYKIGQYEKALASYQQIVSQWPAYEKGCFSQYRIARCCEELAKDNQVSSEEVKAAYQLLIDKYPDSSAAKAAAAKQKWL